MGLRVPDPAVTAVLPGGYLSGERAGKAMESAVLALCAQVSCDPLCPYVTYM